MKFLHYQFNANLGNRVEVVLSGNASNVMLLDDFNFNNYKTGKQFKYYGGYYTRSPIFIPVPSGGHWNLVIDLGGTAGHVDASVRVI